MRFTTSAMWLLLASAAIGCSGGGDSTPKAITQDEQQKMNDAQAKANAEEAAQRKQGK